MATAAEMSMSGPTEDAELVSLGILCCNPIVLPCVDGGLKTGNYCDGPFGFHGPPCLAKDTVGLHHPELASHPFRQSNGQRCVQNATKNMISAMFAGAYPGVRHQHMDFKRMSSSRNEFGASKHVLVTV